MNPAKKAPLQRFTLSSSPISTKICGRLAAYAYIQVRAPHKAGLPDGDTGQESTASGFLLQISRPPGWTASSAGEGNPGEAALLGMARRGSGLVEEAGGKRRRSRFPQGPRHLRGLVETFFFSLAQSIVGLIPSPCGSKFPEKHTANPNPTAGRLRGAPLPLPPSEQKQCAIGSRRPMAQTWGME